MNKSVTRIAVVVALCVYSWQPELLVAAENQSSSKAELTINSESTTLERYPRTETFKQGSVTVDFPTVESWTGFKYLRVWLPVQVSLNGDPEPHIGSLYVQGSTDIDFENRTVTISDIKVLSSKFSDSDRSGEAKALASQAIQYDQNVVPLDVVLRLLPVDFEVPPQRTDAPALSFDPPAIIVSETPLKLLSIDKEPVKAPVEGTALEYVVNTNWNVFYSKPEGRWYVFNDGAWQRNNYLATGDWQTTDKLPDDFAQISGSDRWPGLQRAFPAQMPSSDPVPFMISLEMTELIVLDGQPRLSDIGSTGIRYVSNTKSDLFSFDGNWYFLVSGRWFRSTELDGDWQYADNLPDAFAHIPAGHIKGHVLHSVPGTRQARLSLIEASLPHRKEVDPDASSLLEVSWVGEPRFERIENTRLERGLNTPYQVIRHNNYFYLAFEGAWYFSDSATGPWKAARQVPDEIYRIPATDPAYNVTFVTVEPSDQLDDPVVRYSYTSGYTGSFSTKVAVVYGTGWYYPSNVYWGAGNRPVYWRHTPTYGYHTAYNPIGASYYGRYGHYGSWRNSTTIYIESPTVDFTHGYGSAWDGPLQTTPVEPSKSKVNKLDQFLPEKQSDGTDVFTKTTRAEAKKATKVTAESLYASSALSSNLFSGPDGQVYKKNDNQWARHDNGGWSTMESMEADLNLNAANRRPETQTAERWLPAHKRTLSRAELDEQNRARLEGMDNYSKYRMQKESEQQH